MSSCDSGDILPEAPETGRNIIVTLTLEGTKTIPEARKGTEKYERKLALLYYKNSDMESTPMLAHIKVGDIAENTAEEITIKDAEKVAGSVVLAIIGEDNEIIYSYGKKAIDPSEENTTLDWGAKVNLISYDRLQAQLFDMSCTSCHGSKGAKDLSLTAAKSYNAIVNVDSKTDPSKKLIHPNDAQNSMVYVRLTNEYTQEGYYDHRALTSLKDTDVNLLKEWINTGAKK